MAYIPSMKIKRPRAPRNLDRMTNDPTYEHYAYRPRRPLSFGNRVRRFFGLCPHWWGDWKPIWSANRDPIQFMADDSVVLGHKRECALCGTEQSNYYPDGH